MNQLVEIYSNKRVKFNFAGEHLEFDLSQGLFSSFDIDSGTRLLLKSIAQQVDLASVRSIVDIGCGTGVIGASICRKVPGATCTMQDRDALALEFAKSNSALNGLEQQTTTVGGLGFSMLRGTSFDLSISNLPAKAGLPVLRRIIEDMAVHLNPNGTAAAVVVMTLADQIAEILDDIGAVVSHTEETREHRVYHFRAGPDYTANAEAVGELEPYIRRTGRFSHGRTEYPLETMYNLPDFDTLGWSISQAFELIEKRMSTGIPSRQNGLIVVWNPGQGHLPAFLAKRFNISPDRCVMASRDALQLEAARRNLPGATTYHVPDIVTLGKLIDPGDVALFALFPAPVTGVEWHKRAATVVPGLIETEGFLLSSSSSTQIHRLLSSLSGMVLHGNRKMRGGRSVLLKKAN